MPDRDLISNDNTTTPVQRTVLQIILLVIAAAVCIWLLYALRAVLLLLAFTIIFCYLVAPLVDFFEKPVKLGRFAPRMPRALAIVVVYLLLAGATAVAFEKLAPLLSHQLGAFFDNLPNYARQIDQSVKSLANLPVRLRLPQAWRESLGENFDSALVGVIEWLKSVVFKTALATRYLPWVLLIPLIGFFFLKDAKEISSKLLSTMPRVDLRYRATIFLRDVSETLAGYMRAQVLACFLVGAIEGVGLWLLGVSYPLVFAAAAGLFEFVPVVGPFVLGLTAVLVAGLHSWRSALAVFAFLAIFRVIHDYFIYPRLVSRGVEIHPVAVILAVLCGAELAGVTGVFLSVPVVALLVVCLRHWRDLQLDRASPIIGVDQSHLLESLLIED
jgi:predicted PurR-regulated permease PerM